MNRFVTEKIKSGDYLDASEVVRDGLRRWKQQEASGGVEPDWLEQELQDGLDSRDLPASKTFWRDLRQELHREHKNGPRRR